MDLLMKFEAMMKIRMAGARERERKDRTSLVLKCEPMPRSRRSNQSFTRLRKSRTSRSRKTIRLRLKRAKTAMLEASGTSGVTMPSSKTLTAPIMSRKPAMIRRLRLRRVCSLRSGMVVAGPARPASAEGGLGKEVGALIVAAPMRPASTEGGLGKKVGASLNPGQGVVVGLAGGLLGGAGHAGEERVLAVEGGVGVHTDVEDVSGLEGGRGRELHVAQLREHPLRITQLAGDVGRAGFPLPRRHPALLRHHVVGQVPLDALGQHKPV